MNISDRASGEFSNATILLAMSDMKKQFGFEGRWVYTVEGEGKSVCDGLGGGLKRILRGGSVTNALETPGACAAWLKTATKNTPVRGKYATYKEYYFQEIRKESVVSLPRGKTVEDTKLYYEWRGIGHGKLLRRFLPCFCDACFASKWHLCPNVDTVGNWEAKPVYAE